MIFELVDGRNLLYQWDLNRKITVNDESIKEVHFCNRTGECSLVVEVVDGLANIPNILLQSSFDIRVYGYDGEATLHEELFKVKARTQPSDYVYEEVEIKRYEDLKEELLEEIDIKLNELVEEGFEIKHENLYEHNVSFILDFKNYGVVEPISTVNIKFSILNDNETAFDSDMLQSYLMDNPVSVQGSGKDLNNNLIIFNSISAEGYGSNEVFKLYGTLHKATGTTEEVVHTIYHSAPSSHIPAYGYYIEDSVRSFPMVIDNTPSIEVDLSNYYTKDEVDEALSNVSVDLSGYAKESYVDEAITQSVSGLASEEWVENKNYLTEHQDLSHLADKEHTHEEYALAEHEHEQYLTEHQSLEGYATEEYVDNAIDSVYGNIEEVNTSIVDIYDTINNLNISGDYVSYAEAQELTKEQKDTAKENLELPYIVSEAEVICENKSSGMSTGWSSVSISIGIDGATKLKAMPVGTKFTITAANVAENPTFTETINCELISSSNFSILSDVTNLIFFDKFGSPSISSYALSTYKKDTSSAGLPYNMYFTVIAGETVIANKLDSRLVDLSGYVTKEEFASIKNAEGGAY